MLLIIHVMAVFGFARLAEVLCEFPEWLSIVLTCVFSACGFVYLNLLKERAKNG